MPNISDPEIEKIVKRVVNQIAGEHSAVETPHAQQPKSMPISETPQTAASTNQRGMIAIGADHGGFDLKENLIQYIAEKGYQVLDCGPKDRQSVDYPDFAHAVAQHVSTGKAWRGVMIDGAGIGSCMAANKVPGVRAAMCFDYASAFNSREHNDANVLTLGAGLIGINQAKLIVDTWLDGKFGGGRHARRVDKIVEIEKRYLKR